MDSPATLVFQLSTGREALPVPGARVTVSNPGAGADQTLVTNASGRTSPLPLPAPAPGLGFAPESRALPYGLYNARVEAEGFLSVRVEGIQLFSGVEAVQPLNLCPRPRGLAGDTERVLIIPPATLREARDSTPEGPGEKEPTTPPHLAEVYVPADITVHLGDPGDTAAQNVTVSFQNYLKNVASGEAYPTWPENALRAIILCAVSFALGRVLTGWYKNRGHDFDITSSPSHDQAYVHGRTIFTNVSRLVDDMLGQYVRRAGKTAPLFARHRSGTGVPCEGLSRWGAVALAQNGYTPMGILKRYFGSGIERAATGDIRGVQSGFPAAELRLGSTGAAVRTVETRLSRIRRNYPAIPFIVSVDHTYTPETQAAVAAFQRIFGLFPDGVVDGATWQKISYIYMAVRRLAAPGTLEEPLPETAPAAILREGDLGKEVRCAQQMLLAVSNYYDDVRPPEGDGAFGQGTKNAVLDFQKCFGLAADGVLGPVTWKALYDAYLGIADCCGLAVPYPSTPLWEGSRGDSVWLMQSFLRAVSRRYPIPAASADGVFGPDTEASVAAFQRLFGLAPDGVIGEETWERVVSVRTQFCLQ